VCARCALCAVRCVAVCLINSNQSKRLILKSSHSNARKYNRPFPFSFFLFSTSTRHTVYLYTSFAREYTSAKRTRTSARTF
jgi:hypothetical protein